MIVDAFFFFIHIVKCVRLTLWFTRKVNQEVNQKTMKTSVSHVRCINSNDRSGNLKGKGYVSFLAASYEEDTLKNRIGGE